MVADKRNIVAHRILPLVIGRVIEVQVHPIEIFNRLALIAALKAECSFKSRLSFSVEVSFSAHPLRVSIAGEGAARRRPEAERSSASEFRMHAWRLKKYTPRDRQINTRPMIRGRVSISISSYLAHR